MPRRDELPESISSLARRNALTLRHETFRSDMARLLVAIEQVLGDAARPADSAR